MKDLYIYYGLRAGIESDALIGRGVYDRLKDAKEAAKPYRAYEITRFAEAQGLPRVSRVVEKLEPRP